MGVLGLWQLIESAGRPVALETLEGKVLAVDASILLNQAIKGMKDKQGRTLANAHLAVLFHRVCKLLFYRIKPVFVFDGGAPELKRRTLIRRQQRRDQAAADMVKASESALKNRLKQHALEELVKLECCAQSAVLSSPVSSVSKEKSHGSSRTPSSAATDIYELPPLPANTLSFSDSSSDEDDDNDPVGGYIGIEDANEVDTESSEFLSLPLEMQHEILTEVKDRQKSKHKVNWQELPKSSDDFASYQMSKLVKHSKLTQKISDLRKAMKTRSAGLVLTSSSVPATAGQVGSYTGYNVDANRIASDDHSHYILLKNLRHDRSATGEAESALAAAPPASRSAPLAAAAAPPQAQRSAANVEATGASSSPSTNAGVGSGRLPGSVAVLAGGTAADHSAAAAGPGAPGDCGSDFLHGASDSSSPAASATASSGRVEPRHTSESEAAPTGRQLPQHAPGKQPSAAAPVAATVAAAAAPVAAAAAAAASTLGTEAAPPAVFGTQTDDVALSTADSCSGLLLPLPTRGAPISVVMTTVVDWCTNLQAQGASTGIDIDSELRAATAAAAAAAAAAPPVPFTLSSVRGAGVNHSMADVDSDDDDDDDDDDSSFIEVATVSHGDGTGLVGAAGDFGNDGVEPLLAEAAKPDAEENGAAMRSSVPPPPPAAAVEDSGSNEVKEVEEPFASSEWGSLLSATRTTSLPRASPEGFAEEDVHRLELALETERAKLTREQRKQEATAMTVTEQMVLEAQELLKLFGVPYIVSPSEAEAQCATLEALGLCHGIVTDDSDVWLFGGHMVYKNFFKQDKFVELYKASDIQNLFGLNRNKLIALALVSGSDYTDGIDGAGPVTAMEILSEFNGHGDGITCLKAFAEWWQASKSGGITAEELPKRQRLLRLALPPGFPEDHVTDAYMKPVVDSSNEAFTWANPELHLLRNFALERFGWQQRKTDEMVLPVLQRLNQRQSQLRIDSFFTAHGHTHIDGSYLVDKFKSKRVKKAAGVLLGNNAVTALQSGTSIERTGAPSTTNTEHDSQRLPQQNSRKRSVTGKSKKQKKGKICTDLTSDAFSDSGDDALTMAAMSVCYGESDLGLSANRHGSNDGATTSLATCIKKSSGSSRANGKGRVRSRATSTTGQLAAKSDTALSECRSSGKKRTAAITAGRRVQACVDLSESSSDNE